MPTRRNRSGQFSKRATRRRRTQPKTNLTDVAQSALVASAITNGVFGTDLATFFTQGWGGKNVQTPYTTSITLPDLFERLIPGGSDGKVNRTFPDTTDAIKSNLQRDGAKMVGQVIAIPLFFNVAKKLLRKPVIMPANKMLKSAGLKDFKV